MLINLETALALLLLSLIGGGIPSVAGQNAVSNITASDIIDLVDNSTETDTEDGSPLTVGGGIPSVAGQNEVELNPQGNDMAKQWIELYNPAAVDVNISNFEIRPLFQSATIKLPSDAVIEAGETYVIELNRPILSHTAESLTLANATGDIKDRTPS